MLSIGEPGSERRYDSPRPPPRRNSNSILSSDQRALELGAEADNFGSENSPDKTESEAATVTKPMDQIITKAWKRGEEKMREEIELRRQKRE